MRTIACPDCKARLQVREGAVTARCRECRARFALKDLPAALPSEIVAFPARPLVETILDLDEAVKALRRQSRKKS